MAHHHGGRGQRGGRRGGISGAHNYHGGRGQRGRRGGGSDRSLVDVEEGRRIATASGSGRRRGRGRDQGSGPSRATACSVGEAPERDGGGGWNLGHCRRPRRAILVLHGSRQTGELFLGRIDKLRKRLLKLKLVGTNADNDGGGGGVEGGGPVELVAPDAPFVWRDDDSDGDDDGDEAREKEEVSMRTWWHRNGDSYEGLEDSLRLCRDVWTSSLSSDQLSFEGVLGFSQGARLAHLLAWLHHTESTATSKQQWLPGLKYVICAGGYGDVPMPSNLPSAAAVAAGAIDAGSSSSSNEEPEEEESIINLRSLHVAGRSDVLISVSSSEALAQRYVDPIFRIHDGGHCVPVKSGDVDSYIAFIEKSSLHPRSSSSSGGSTSADTLSPPPTCEAVGNNAAMSRGSEKELASYEGRTVTKASTAGETDVRLNPMMPLSTPSPDEEHTQSQLDEVEALALIYPDEFRLLSGATPPFGEGDGDDCVDPGGRTYKHPIRYAIRLNPPLDDIDDAIKSLWPPRDVSLEVEYPPTYPDELPQLSLRHEMNLLELKLNQIDRCLTMVRDAAMEESGMPCVMGCVQAARNWFEIGGMTDANSNVDEKGGDEEVSKPSEAEDASLTIAGSLLRRISPERVKECRDQGWQIAREVLGHPHQVAEEADGGGGRDFDGDAADFAAAKGGSWKYIIGLVGKPSAGKSTFFNAATAFARQRGGSGATKGETSDGDAAPLGGAAMAPHPFTTIDPNVGYCLVPAPPGSCPEDDIVGGDHGMAVTEFASTHGRDSRGRRLLPVILKDVAGLVPGAYQGRGKGNKFLDDLTDADTLIHVVDASGSADDEGNAIGTATHHPLNDLAWVQNELLEWVYSNLAVKWDNIVRRGRDKLAGMFSGYKQSQAFVHEVLLTVEKYMFEREGRDHALNHLDSWDEGDLHRLVSAYLGVRFPMALALNKSDLPSALNYVADVQGELPAHGAHIGVPLSAQREMLFMKSHIRTASNGQITQAGDPFSTSPNGVMGCLQSAMMLREPVLVFPVCDMTTYEPLSGMTNCALRDASLPNAGMVSCLKAAGGWAPTHWDCDRGTYVPRSSSDGCQYALRDVLVMKPGSSVEDVFFALKCIGALGGEFVRAEGAGQIGEKPKLVPKTDQISRHNRILKIMTNRRKEWKK